MGYSIWKGHFIGCYKSPIYVPKGDECSSIRSIWTGQTDEWMSLYKNCNMCDTIHERSDEGEDSYKSRQFGE